MIKEIVCIEENYTSLFVINDEIDKFNKDMQSIFSMILFFYRKMVILGNWAKNRKEHHSWFKDDA